MTDANKQSYKFPLIIMMLLFFLLGFFTIMSNSMIDFLKIKFSLTESKSQFVNLAFYGSYLLSIPIGYLIDKIGYRKGVVAGMLVITLGLFMFIPAIGVGFSLFLFTFFMLGLGDSFLNVAVNPYILALGPKETAASRLNLAGGLNSLATFIAPLFVSALIVDRANVAEKAATLAGNAPEVVKAIGTHTGVYWPAIGAAVFALLIAVILMFLKLPDVSAEEDAVDETKTAKTSVWQHKNMIFGFFAIAVYVSAEVGVPSLLLRYFKETGADMVIPSWLAGVIGSGATSFLALYWAGLMIGRFAGSWLNTVFNPAKLLAAFAAISAILLLSSIMSTGNIAIVFMLLIGLFHSIMWPNINDIGLAGLGKFAKKGSGILCTGVAGAAGFTVLMGYVAEKTGSYATAYSLIFVCYAYILIYALIGPKLAEK